MKRRRRNKQYENEEAVELNEVLEPYDELQWADENGYADNVQDESAGYVEGYEEFYSDEYSEEHELADSEGRFRVAIGVFDLISIIIGIVVILVLVSMLITLFNWLRNDILHSALLLQSGLQ